MRGAALVCAGSMLASGCGLLLDLSPASDGSVTIRPDGSILDGSVRLDASADAGPPRDGGCPAMGSEIVCAPFTGVTATSGLGLGEMFWVGFRFEVPPGCSVTLARIGLTAHSNVGTAESVFGALLALAGPTDNPDASRLASADVLGTTIMDLPPAVSTTTSGELSLVLSPGWYAAVFGGGAFGATITDAIVYTQGGATQCENGTSSFTINTSTGNFAGQVAGPHLFVVLAP